LSLSHLGIYSEDGANHEGSCLASTVLSLCNETEEVRRWPVSLVRVLCENVGDGHALNAGRLRPDELFFDCLEEAFCDLEVNLIVPTERLVDEGALVAVEYQWVKLRVLDLEDLVL